MFKKSALIRTIIVPVIIAAIVSAVFVMDRLEKFELISIDLRYRFMSESPTFPVSLLAIDQNSIKEIGYWPWPRYIYAQILEILEKSGVKSLLVDLDFSSRSHDTASDKLFIKAVGSTIPVYMAMHMEEKENELGFRVLNASLPFPELSEASEDIASIVFGVDTDGAVRTMPLPMEFGDRTFMPLGFMGAKSINDSVKYDPPKGALIDLTAGLLRSIPVIPVVDLLNGDYDPGDFAGRIVLLGATAQDLRDFWRTSQGIIPGVYLHAAVMRTVINRSWITRMGVNSTIFFIFGASLLLGLAMGRAGWKLGAIALAGYLVVITISAFSLLSLHLMMQVVPILLVGIIQYPVQVAIHARTTEEVLDMERKRTDAILKMSELEDAEETGQEPYVVPLVLLRQVLGLDTVKLFLLKGELRDEWVEEAVIGDEDIEFEHELLDEAVNKGELITVKTEQKEGTVVYVPLRTVRKPLGALIVGGPEDFHATENEQRMLLSYATQTAYFLESRELAERMKEEELVRTNLARYLSPQIVEQVIQKKMEVNLGGNRKTVTTMFSDIRKFTTLSETLPPDQLVAILNEYFNEMANIIFYYKGSLDKYIGDALIAVYGSLIEVENPVYNCVQTAIGMMKIMPMLNSKWSRLYDGFNMEIGIGINTGEVFLGNIGSNERMEFTVIGDAVNVASRFSDLAEPGQILLTEPAWELVSGMVEINELEAAQVKGKSEKLRVFEVVY